MASRRGIGAGLVVSLVALATIATMGAAGGPPVGAAPGPDPAGESDPIPAAEPVVPSGTASPEDPEPVFEAQIIGGTRVRRGELPWSSLLIIELPGGLAQCGGSLIAPRWIVTAAHCVTANRAVVRGDAVRAVVGVSRRPTTLADDRWVRSVDVHVHPNFVPTTLANDVALVRLARRVRRTPLPVARPNQSHLFDAGTRATVAGWGRTGPDSPVSTFLRKATVPIRTTGRCRSVFPGFRAARELCAGWLGSEASAPAGSCQGDSGSALTVFARFGPTLAGVVSYGLGSCTLLGRPGVYARTDLHRAWIVDVVGSLPPPPRTPRCAGRRATLSGTIGDDQLVGTPRRDVVVARAGADRVSGLRGDDLVCLGGGRDVAWTGPGADRVFGGGGRDVMRGREGADRLIGGDGPDALDGGPGRDLCHGGPGRDSAVRCEIRTSARSGGS